MLTEFNTHDDDIMHKLRFNILHKTFVGQLTPRKCQKYQYIIQNESMKNNVRKMLIQFMSNKAYLNK